MKNIWGLIVLLLVAIFLFSMLSGAVGEPHSVVEGKINARDYQVHGVIRINNDTEFDTIAQQEGWRGNGGYLDPYIIENYEIDAHGKSAIYIGNTTKYFIIQYGHFYNSTLTSRYYMGAINLYRVTHGYITGCNISDSTYGVAFTTYTYDCELSYTEFYQVSKGVYIYFHTTDISVHHNNFYNTFVSGTTVEISYDSHDNTISFNTIKNTGTAFYLNGRFDVVYNNRISRNTVDNTADYGVEIYLTYGPNYVENNTFKNSHKAGISLYAGVSKVKIVNNSIINCIDYGIELYDTWGILIYNNSLVGNNGATDTYDPNHVQAYSNGTNIAWYYKDRGNYWSDWNSPDSNNDGIVDSPYMLDGDNESKDPYPLAEPPTEIPEISPFWIILVFSLLIAVLRRDLW